MVHAIRRRLDRLHEEQGISLVEMLVAMTIVMISLLALASTMTASAFAVVDQRTRSEATRVASELLEQLRVEVWRDEATYDFALLPRTDTHTRTVGPTTYTVTTTVEGLDATTGATGTDVKQISADVQWTSHSTARSLQVSTVVSSDGTVVPNTPQLLVDMAPNPVPGISNGAGYQKPETDVEVFVGLVGDEYTGNVTIDWTNHDGTVRQLVLSNGVDNQWSGVISQDLIAAEWDAILLAEGKAESVMTFTVEAGPHSTDYDLELFGYREDQVLLYDFTVTPNIRVRGGTVCGVIGDKRNLDELTIEVSALPDDIPDSQITVQVSWDGTPYSTAPGGVTTPITLTRSSGDPRLWRAVIPVQDAQLQPGSRTFTVSATSLDPAVDSNVVEFVRPVTEVSVPWTYQGDGSLYTAGEDKVLRKLNADGSQAWSWPPSPDKKWFDVTVDGSHVYVVGEDRTVRKLDLNGNLVWTFTAPNQLFGVALDPEGNVYVASRDKRVHKVRGDGTYVGASVELSGEVRDVAIGPNNEVYAGTSSNSIHRINPTTGAIMWTSPTGAGTAFGLAVDTNGYVYVATQNKKLLKLDSNGSVVTVDVLHSGEIFDVAVDANGFVYTVSKDHQVRKINAAGLTLVWSATLPNDLYSVAVDYAGNVYAGSDQDEVVHKVDANGNWVWNSADHTNKVNGVAVSPGKHAVAGHCQ